MFLAHNTMKYPFVILTGFLVTFVFTQAVKRLAPSAGWMDVPDDRHVHKHPTPRAGGIAVFLGFHAGCAAVLLMPWSSFDTHLDAMWWWRYLIVSSIILILGLVDDRSNLRPATKLLGQIVAATIAFYMGMEVNRVLGFNLPPLLNLLATILWFVAITNAFNLIDGMDGVASGLGLIAAIGLGGALAFRHLPGDALVAFALAAACLAFLRYNFSPASIFLGDSGSMFIGFTLAALALSTGSKDAAMATIGIPLLAIGIPIFDTALAIWRRSARTIIHATSPEADTEPSPIFAADLDHLHHRLQRSGMSNRRVAVVLYLGAALLVCVGVTSLIFQAHAAGIYLVVFAAGTYVTVRHLARVELWDSARAIVTGLRRPRGKVVSVLMYPVGDALLLAVALAVATAAALPQEIDIGWKRFWFDQLPLWAGVPFLTMLMFGAYRRVWTRARISEYFMLAASVALGVILAAGLSVLTGQFDNLWAVSVFNIESTGDVTVILGSQLSRGLTQQLIIHTSLAMIFTTVYRAIPRAVQDGMALTSLRGDHGDGGERTLVYGTRENSLVFVTLAGRQQLDGIASMEVVGLIDDDRNLHGRIVNGYRVLGSVEHLKTLVSRHRIRKLILTYQLPDPVLQELIAVARDTGLEIIRWRYDFSPVSDPPSHHGHSASTEIPTT